MYILLPLAFIDSGGGPFSQRPAVGGKLSPCEPG